MSLSSWLLNAGWLALRGLRPPMQEAKKYGKAVCICIAKPAAAEVGPQGSTPTLFLKFHFPHADKLGSDDLGPLKPHATVVAQCMWAMSWGVWDRRHAPLPEATPGIRFDPSTRHPLSGISHRPRPSKWRLRLGPRTFMLHGPQTFLLATSTPKIRHYQSRAQPKFLPTVARRSVAASQPSDDALTAVARLRHWFLSLLHDS